jgi:hypothetical protein
MLEMASGLLTLMTFYATWSESQVPVTTHCELERGTSSDSKDITQYSKIFE